MSAGARSESPKKLPSLDSSILLEIVVAGVWENPGLDPWGTGEPQRVLFRKGTRSEHFSRVPDPSEDTGGIEVSDPFPGLQGTFRDADRGRHPGLCGRGRA